MKGTDCVSAVNTGLHKPEMAEWAVMMTEHHIFLSLFPDDTATFFNLIFPLAA